MVCGKLHQYAFAGALIRPVLMPKRFNGTAMYPYRNHHAVGYLPQYHACEDCDEKFQMIEVTQWHVSEIDKKSSLLETSIEPVKFGYCKLCGGMPKTISKIKRGYTKDYGLVLGYILHLLNRQPYIEID